MIHHRLANEHSRILVSWSLGGGGRERWGVRGLEGADRTLGEHVSQKVADDVSDTDQVAHRDHVLALLCSQYW